ncbi:hypothetical protein N0V92_002325 [Colletotrichum tropicale]|nr:hypothetical protein N0V92_002325 [Colletotrichum tropicale]
MGYESGVQVLHLSMPRTGSTSMKAAYEELGLPTYHGFEYMLRPDDQKAWTEAYLAKYEGKGTPFGRKEFDEILKGWAVLSDCPVLGFTDDLLEAYPEAKVVLVDRDIDSWYKSFNECVVAPFSDWQAWMVINIFERFKNRQPTIMTQKVLYKIFDAHDISSWRENLKKTNLEHAEKIRRVVPKERLLEYKLGSGWEPLCTFLGKDVPDKPFPHLNDSVEFEKWTREFKDQQLKQGLLAFLKYGAVPVIAAAATIFLRRVRA